MKNEKTYWIRNLIAMSVTFIAIAATVTVAIKLLFFTTAANDPGIDFIGKSLLPLWATWIGTVMAFYFSKENFESASRSYQDIIKTLTPEEKLASIPAISIMIEYEKIAKLKKPGDMKKTLKEILELKDFKVYSRYAVFDQDQKLAMMVHRSTIYQYRSDLIDDGKKTAEIGTITFQEMIDTCSPSIKAMLENGYNFIPKTATLLDAKKAMDAIKECQDVFISETGSKNEPVLGLITNNMLLDNAKV